VSREPIRKEASGRYVVVLDVAAPGEPRKQLKRRFDTQRDARDWLRKTQHELREGMFVEPRRTTFAEFVDEWVVRQRLQVRPSTAASYERYLRLHAVPTLGQRPMQAIRTGELEKMYVRLLVDGKLNCRAESVGGLSRRSVAYLHTIVGKLFKTAVKDGLLRVNPAVGADVPSADAQADRHERINTWRRAVLADFLVRSRDHRHATAWLLLATTGVRRSEALGLGWQYVDLDAGRLSVVRILAAVEDNDPVWADPKTKRGRRVIALDRATVAALKALRVEQAREKLAVGPGYVDHDLVFCRPDGMPWHPDRFTRTFQRKVRELGLPMIRLHDLRHTWATLALESGVHPKVVSERLGHSTVSITLDIYSHVSPAMQTDAAERVAALFTVS
jgi:integrase